MKIYNESDCLVPGVLRDVTRGVYIMQSKTEPTLFRFGQIGAGGAASENPTDTNCAEKRLKQCGGTWRIPVGATPHGAPEDFHFVFLAHTPGASKLQIKALERELRKAIRERYPDSYRNDLKVTRWNDGLIKLANPQDAFVSDDLKSVIDLACKAWASATDRLGWPSSSPAGG